MRVAEDRDTEMRIPLIEETMAVSKHQVETGRVQIRTIVEEHAENVVADLAHEQIDVSRRAVERQVDATPSPYEQEDGAWIVPIIEERLVIEKRLFVVEEIVMRRSTISEKVTVPTTVRTMRAVVERDDKHQVRRD